MPAAKKHPASFRDPSGFIFERDGKLYRQVNVVYKEEYDQLLSSGLHNLLVKQRQIIPHKEVNDIPEFSTDCYKILEPLQLNIISYPYEWCFEQLKDAALLTLSVARQALDHRMILKDATPYNIQFTEGKPVLIDTLSFSRYDHTKPWIAYRQFCNTFLFPLFLAHYKGIDIHKLLTAYPEGVTNAFTGRLLPFASWIHSGTLLHVHLQNSVRANSSDKSVRPFSRKKMVDLLTHLEGVVSRLQFSPSADSEWSDYYKSSILSPQYLAEKEKIFTRMIDELPPGLVLDMGANDGYFSKILARKNFHVIAIDGDSTSINRLYIEAKLANESKILPLIIDLINPSPASGFQLAERLSFDQRVRPELVTALALVHHLAIAKNIPLERLAAYFATMAPLLIIEWVPKEDVKVQQMLSNREDIFPDYTSENFERHFSGYFTILKKVETGSTGRWIYLMKRSKF